MKAVMNRSTDLWRSWQDKEKELRDLLADNLTSSDLRRQQYAFLTEGIFRIEVDASPHERFSLNMMRSVTAGLRKALYPNPVLRFLMLLKERLVDRPKFLRSYRSNLLKSVDRLDSELQVLGFGEHRNAIIEQMVKGEDVAKVKLTRSYTSDNRLFMADFVCKREDAGDYRLDRYDVALGDSFGDGTVTAAFDPKDRITDIQAFNLLDGRAMCVTNPDSVRPEGTWLKLDTNHPSGWESQLIEVKPPADFDLGAQVVELKAITKSEQIDIRETLEALRIGGRLAVDVGQQRYFFEASPQSAALRINDSTKKTISIHELSKRMQRKSAELETTVAKLRPVAPGPTHRRVEKDEIYQRP